MKIIVPDRDEATKRGAEVLDKMVPGWYKDVDLDVLQMASGSLCMLGQLFGAQVETCVAKEMYPEMWKKLPKHENGYWRGRHMLYTWIGTHRINEDDKSKLLHACRATADKCDWVREVADRLAADADSEAEGGQS